MLVTVCSIYVLYSGHPIIYTLNAFNTYNIDFTMTLCFLLCPPFALMPRGVVPSLVGPSKHGEIHRDEVVVVVRTKESTIL